MMQEQFALSFASPPFFPLTHNRASHYYEGAQRHKTPPQAYFHLHVTASAYKFFNFTNQFICTHILISSFSTIGIRNDPLRFTEVVDVLEGEGFLLLPTGGNLVSIIHNCYSRWMREN
jgi:hypothetical protein